MFPFWWTVHPTGAEGMNLIFETDKGHEIFVQLTTTNLPLEQADEATYSFERSGPDPLVNPDESQVSKKIQNVGDKKVLVLITTNSDQTIKRYFMIHNGTLYMFEVKMSEKNFDAEESMVLFLQIEEIISSMQFVR